MRTDIENPKWVSGGFRLYHHSRTFRNGQIAAPESQSNARLNAAGRGPDQSPTAAKCPPPNSLSTSFGTLS
ncbi:hypothetical protein, partial [Mesorhizobium sp.]|uniref:hypothetical protein n=1 Tax=Mesorhizobium sp. TaxID=1871066 RepID=UPI0025C13431